MNTHFLVGDVGGTNARFALCDWQSGELSHLRKYPTSAHKTFGDSVQEYLHFTGKSVTQACIAIACPTDADVIKMTNHHWTFSVTDLKNKLKLDSLVFINDFHANAMAVPVLKKEDIITVADFPKDISKPVTIVGPGTGLGVAHLVPFQNHWITLPGEGGHTEFSACNDKEFGIYKILLSRFGRVSMERILSGPGLVNLYESIAVLANRKPIEMTPGEITEHAINSTCEDCVEALTLFCNVLGRFSGSLALTFNSRGGVYLAGGIVPRFIDFFMSSDFNRFFTEKGRFKRYVGDIPVYVVTHPDMGLLGAGAFFRHERGYHI